uniref:Uncharacterized protein n=1 Tax=Setaria italica TaxID=4555 RepID=K4AK84_SETIT
MRALLLSFSSKDSLQYHFLGSRIIVFVLFSKPMFVECC